MGALLVLRLQPTILIYFILLHASNSNTTATATATATAPAPPAAQDGVWKSATATYFKETDASIITGNPPPTSFVFCHIQSCSFTFLYTQVYYACFAFCGGCFEVRCVDHILWCLQGSPSITLTATDFCPPNYGLPADYGGWCNFPRAHFEISEAAFAEIADITRRADIVPIQYRRVKCERNGGMRFTVYGTSFFYQVLITNVGSDGQVVAVKVKGSKTGWIPMGRNWGQNWQCDINLTGQPLSFEVTTSSQRSITSYNVAPANWRFGQTFEGKQF